MHKWRRINQVLAGVVLVLSVFALGKLGIKWWQMQTIHPEKTVVGAPEPSAQAASSQLALDGFSYRTSVDFLAQPTLVVRYRLHNRGKDAALPQYVFDNNVTFAQQTASGTTSVLASTTVAKGKLSYLDQNYQENGAILLKPGQSVTVIGTYRLESLKRPATLAVRGTKKAQIAPWQLKGVQAHD
ncbi:hypothetical protein ACFQ5J_11670 [Lacticaseibacillus baoqingensis]|uniref:DUF5067 domain-containing protein n=1 Tax=Lacticaseibacillus baoqingensis TaxID=2486013 RepID=A0ABW4E7P6_9LACO|nr:hypothetical protein [Lacticaseibacillus baoqingensis]